MHQSVTARSNRVRRALRHRRARQHVPAGHVVWVYAITGGLAPDQLDGLTGVGGERVRAVTEAGLTAVVGSVDGRTFGEQARASLMSDLASIERLGRAHHQVIACVAADGPVLPLRLATVYPDDQTVRALLGQSSAEFAVILDSFRGTEEWGVRLYAGADEAAAPQAAQAGPAGGLAALSSLGDRLAGHREPGRPDGDLITPMPAAENAEAVAEMIDRALTGIAIASRHHTAQDPRFDISEKGVVLNAAYLVFSDRAGEFATVARALTRAHQEVGADLTGPWPPYSFADIRPSLSPRAMAKFASGSGALAGHVGHGCDAAPGRGPAAIEHHR
jgi:hypothetical protein